MSKTAREIIAESKQTISAWSNDHTAADLLINADDIIAALTAAGFVIVPKLVRGETPGKVAAWRAFLKAMGSEMPRNKDGTYNGTFDHAMQSAIDAYLTATQEPKP